MLLLQIARLARCRYAPARRQFGAAHITLATAEIAELDAATPLAPVYPNWLSDNLVNRPAAARYETNETRRSSAVPSLQRRLIHRQQNVLDTILAESLQRTKADRPGTLQRRLVA